MRFQNSLIVLLSCILLSNSFAVASVKTTVVNNQNATFSRVASDELTRGLREALTIGTNKAIRELGRDGGFYNNSRVKIPMPKSLRPVEKTLRVFGKGKMADDFIAAMNRAAERAVPVAASVFVDSIMQMTFQDARNIISGPDDAATQFFRRTGEDRLREEFLPIIQRFTEEVGVTAKYKQMIKRAGPLARLGGEDATDIDAYVTQKALDGLFLLIADEEKRIRQNPVARTTELLRKIFGVGGRARSNNY